MYKYITATQHYSNNTPTKKRDIRTLLLLSLKTHLLTRVLRLGRVFFFSFFSLFLSLTTWTSAPTRQQVSPSCHSIVSELFPELFFYLLSLRQIQRDRYSNASQALPSTNCDGGGSSKNSYSYSTCLSILLYFVLRAGAPLLVSANQANQSAAQVTEHHSKRKNKTLGLGPSAIIPHQPLTTFVRI